MNPDRLRRRGNRKRNQREQPGRYTAFRHLEFEGLEDRRLTVLESNNLARGWRGKRVKDIHQRLASEIPFDELRAEVRRVEETTTIENLEWLSSLSFRELKLIT